MKKPPVGKLLTIGLSVLGIAYFAAAAFVGWVIFNVVDPQRIIENGFSGLLQNPQFLYVIILPVIHIVCGYFSFRTALSKNADEKKKLLTLGAGIILLGLLLFL